MSLDDHMYTFYVSNVDNVSSIQKAPPPSSKSTMHDQGASVVSNTIYI